MNNLVSQLVQTMTSLELVQIINDLREEGKAELRHNNFTAKVREVLGETEAAKFSAPLKTPSGQVAQGYILPKRECHLMVMSESYKVQAAVYDRMGELEKEKTDVSRLTKVNKALIALAKQNGLKGNQAIISADRATEKLEGISPLKLLGIELVAEVKSQSYTPTEIGAMLEDKLSAQKVNKILEAKGFQVKMGDKWEPTEKGKPFGEMIDTTKRHSDGSPVKQWKWFSTILNEIK
jgi:hypothetical protein